jgi:hypothetical protein
MRDQWPGKYDEAVAAPTVCPPHSREESRILKDGDLCVHAAEKGDQWSYFADEWFYFVSDEPAMLHFGDLLTPWVYRIVEKEALKKTEMTSICDEELLGRDQWLTYRISGAQFGDVHAFEGSVGA